MTVTIVGSPFSTCTKRAAVVCKQLNVPYKLEVIDFAKAEHKAPNFVAKQPFGQVPYLIDEDGFVLYESRAIGRYIALKYGKGSSLLPPSSDIKATALFEQAASIEQFNFDPFASGIVGEKVFKAYRGQTADEKRVETLSASLEQKMDAYEVILSKQNYLAGDHLTLADLFHLSYGVMVLKFVDFTKGRPHVARWWNEITSLESWKAVENGA